MENDYCIVKPFTDNPWGPRYNESTLRRAVSQQPSEGERSAVRAGPCFEYIPYQGATAVEYRQRYALPCSHLRLDGGMDGCFLGFFGLKSREAAKKKVLENQKRGTFWIDKQD